MAGTLSDQVVPRTVRPVTSGKSESGRTTFDAWVERNSYSSAKVAEMAVKACEILGLPEEEAPSRKAIDDYRTGRHTPSASAILILRTVTGGEIDVQHWVRDAINRPAYVAPRRRGPPPGKMAYAAELVAVGIGQITAAALADCSRQAVSQYVKRHGLPEVSDERRAELLEELTENAKAPRDEVSKLAASIKRRSKRSNSSASANS